MIKREIEALHQKLTDLGVKHEYSVKSNHYRIEFEDISNSKRYWVIQLIAKEGITSADLQFDYGYDDTVLVGFGFSDEEIVFETADDTIDCIKKIIKKDSIVIEKAINYFGVQLQIIVAIEELAELQKELTKFLRADNNEKCAIYDEDNIIEEIADVTIMIKQLMVIFEVNQEIVDKMIEYKLERLNQYLDNISGEIDENS